MPYALGSRRLGDPVIQILFGFEKAHLFGFDVTGSRTDLQGRDRILDNGVKKGKGQIHAMLIDDKMKLAHLAQRLGVALKMIKIV